MRFLSLIATTTVVPWTLAIPNMYLLMETDNPDPSACLRSCFKDKPACPSNMDPHKLGDCWTCCLRMEKGYKILDDLQDQEMCHLKLGDPCCKAQGCAWCCKGICSADKFAGWEGHCWRGG
ncbi:hypothetical protein BDV12DRAFT_176782 [Aspergillus spectabilis]